MKILKFAFAYILLIAVWQGVYMFNVNIIEIWKSYSFPSPMGVLESLKGLIISGTLLNALLVSVRRIIEGFMLSAVIGVVAGVILARFKFISQSYSAVFLAIQTLPSVCWIPFAILWFGISEKTIMFVIVIGATAAIALATEMGIKSVNPLYIKAGRNMGASGLKLYSSIIFPAAIPQILLGLKQGWSFAFRGLMAGEMLASSMGLGQILTAGRELADINQVTAVIFIIIVFGLLADKCIFSPADKRIRSRWGLD